MAKFDILLMEFACMDQSETEKKLRMAGLWTKIGPGTPEYTAGVLPT